MTDRLKRARIELLLQQDDTVISEQVLLTLGFHKSEPYHNGDIHYGLRPSLDKFFVRECRGDFYFWGYPIKTIKDWKYWLRGDDGLSYWLLYRKID